VRSVNLLTRSGISLLPSDSLKDLLSQELSDRDRLLICLAVQPVGPRRIGDILAIALQAGWRASKKKNLSDFLRRATGLAVRTDKGWELTAAGAQHVARIAGPLLNSPLPKVASSLRAHLVKIKDADTLAFVEEAIVCFETRQYRAATVLSWVGALAVLHNQAVLHHLVDFNKEASRRDPRWKPAKNEDDLGLMKEDTFLDILQAISAIGKNVKQELKKCLELRNGCGHPNSLKVAEHKVAAHIEDLLLNVFAKYA
jgi:hypothetical protein